MNVIFVGVQGSGKGTQAKIVAKEMGLYHISTGDLLRSSTGELKKRVDELIDAGRLAPSELVIDILKKRMEDEDCRDGIILDGFPRNLEQAEFLDGVIDVDSVVEIKISDEEALKRLSGRVGCEKCGAGYNLYTAPKPKESEKCDKCDGKLVKRADDNEEAIRKRIQSYHNDTEPILEYYGEKVVVVDGERGIEEIAEDIIDRLKG